MQPLGELIYVILLKTLISHRRFECGNRCQLGFRQRSCVEFCTQILPRQLHDFITAALEKSTGGKGNLQSSNFVAYSSCLLLNHSVLNFQIDNVFVENYDCNPEFSP